MMNRFKILFGLGVLILQGFIPVSAVQAESSKLQQLVAELPNHPDDEIAIREKIIKLVLAMPAKPALPDGVDEALGKAKFIMSNGTICPIPAPMIFRILISFCRCCVVNAINPSKPRQVIRMVRIEKLVNILPRF